MWPLWCEHMPMVTVVSNNGGWTVVEKGIE
jgi:hypothetical protein